MHSGLAQLEHSIDRLRAEYTEQLVAVQTTCAHEHVFERDYYSIAEWLPAHSPVRICKNCGLCEEGWGCGYVVLTSPQTVEKIGRDEEGRYWRGKRIFDADKGPLLRKKKSLRQLLEGQNRG